MRTTWQTRLKTRLSRLLALAAAVCLLPLAAGVADDAQGVWPEAVFDMAADEALSWRFAYDDAYFAKPDDAYQHKLAQASLGMALSAFRDDKAPLDEQGDNARAYLTQAGFGALQCDQYHDAPAKDTVSTMIGCKALSDSTVVAVAVCGGNYADEWLSNFDIGDETYHAGFRKAARMVEARIRDYLTAQGIEGAVKLWISGYSRGAAIANLTAAAMTDSGLFSGVYAYTFATPRNTREAGSYNNIFNIVGKFDPVAGIPFAEWGYARHGIDLYTPAQETDTRYRQLKATASGVYERLTGIPFWNNVEQNHTLHTIFDFLLTVVPDAGVYTDKMQPILESVWRDRGLGNLTDTIMRLMEEARLLDSTNREEMEYLLDYLSMTTYSAVVGQSGWNQKTTMMENLMHEHFPSVYVAWMCSTDDGDELFNQNLDYVRLTFQGRVKLMVSNEAGFCLSVSEDGTPSDWSEHEGLMDSAPPLEQRPLLSVARKGTQTILTLPKDNVYVVMLEAPKAETLTYFGTRYTVGTLRGDMQEMNQLSMEEGACYTALSFSSEIAQAEGIDEVIFADNDFAYSLWSEELPYSPAVLMAMENENVFHLTWNQVIWLIAAVALLLIAVIALTVVLLVRRRRRKKRLKAAQTKEETPNATDAATTTDQS